MRYLVYTLLLLSLIATGACAYNTASPEQENQASAQNTSSHPPLSEQDKLKPCSQCHQQATPQIYEQWFHSTHGIGKVKCYQCHGTYENLRTTPQQSTCGVCHAKQVASAPEDTSCWQCHPAHSFRGHAPSKGGE